MRRIPPLLPSEVLRRVLRVARFNGTSVLTVAAFFGLATAMDHDKAGTLIGAMVAGTGALELHGFGLLRHGDSRGVRWLVMSQLALLAIILGYVWTQITHFDMAAMHALVGELLRNLFTEAQRPIFINQERTVLAQAGMSPDEFIRKLFVLTYTIVAAVSVAYQGGLAVYYLRRRSAVAHALEEPEE